MEEGLHMFTSSPSLFDKDEPALLHTTGSRAMKTQNTHACKQTPTGVVCGRSAWVGRIFHCAGSHMNKHACKDQEDVHLFSTSSFIQFSVYLGQSASAEFHMFTLTL